MEARRVLAHELSEVVLRDEPVLDHFPRLLQHLGHVRHVEVTDVGAEDRTEAMVAVAIEGPRGDRVVGLAAEEEPLGEVLA